MIHNYHMIDYIHQVPDVLEKTLSANNDSMRRIADKVRQKAIRKVIISGVGSSYTAGMIVAPIFMKCSQLPVYILPSTEISPYLDGFIDDHTLVVAVSRSGERGWVVDSFNEAMRRGAMGVAVTGTANSLLAQSTSEVLLAQEGIESSFPKTKSVVTHAGLLAYLAVALASPGDGDAARVSKELFGVPGAIQAVLKACEPQVQALMPVLQGFKNLMMAGTMGNYGVALEGTLKLQEASGVVVVGNETGNMLHGPWGMLSPDWLLTLLVTQYDLELSRINLHLAGKIGVKRLAIAEQGINLGSLVEHQITLPVNPDPFMAGMVFLPVVQLLTYYWAVTNGLDPDSPAYSGDVLEAMLPEGRQEP